MNEISDCILSKLIKLLFQTFLQLEELDQSSIEDVSGLRPKPADCVVEVDHLTAKWDPVSHFNTRTGSDYHFHFYVF